MSRPTAQTKIPRCLDDAAKLIEDVLCVNGPLTANERMMNARQREMLRGTRGRVPGFYSSKNVRKTEEKPENVRCILYKMVEKRLHRLTEIVGVGIYDGG